MGNLLHLWAIIMKRAKVKLVGSGLNRNGYRVIPKGMRIDNFLQNPIVSYNHIALGRGWASIDKTIPVGKLENLTFDESQDFWTGDIVFNPHTEFSESIGLSFNDGFLNAVSIGFRVVASSEDEELFVQGQTRPTVTEFELLELSVVDIPAYPSATRQAMHLIRHDDKWLHADSDDTKTLNSVLPIIGNKKIKSERMNKDILRALNLTEDADELKVYSEIEKLKVKAKSEEDKRIAIEKDLHALEVERNDERCDSMVQSFVDNGTITESAKAFYVKTAKQSADMFEEVKTQLTSMPSYERPTNQLAAAEATAVKAGKPDPKTVADAKFYYLNMDTGVLGELRSTDPARYAELEAAAELHPELLNYKEEK